MKAVVEYYLGKNSILIIPSVSLDSKELKDWLSPIWTILIDSIRVKFPPHQGFNDKLITVVGFLKPEVIDKIALQNNSNKKKPMQI